MARFVGTPVLFRPLFAVLVVTLLVLLIRRGESFDLAIAGFLAAALLLTARFFVISIARDCRYLYLMDLAAVTRVFRLIAGPKKISSLAEPF